MDDFWVVTTAAATVATAVSTSVTLWFRQRDRPEAAWELIDRFSVTDEEPERDVVRLINAGDGAAHQVQVTGRNCVVQRLDDRGVQVRSEPSQAVMNPGDSMRLRVLHAGRPVDARLRVVWVPTPTRVSRAIIEVIPLAEAAVLETTGRRTGPSEWRYRELPWWRLLQRLQQRRTRRARDRERLRTAQERRAMHRWQAQGQGRST